MSFYCEVGFPYDLFSVLQETMNVEVYLSLDYSKYDKIAEKTYYEIDLIKQKLKKRIRLIWIGNI